MDTPDNVEMIPVAKIHVLNPRNRDKHKFADLVANIAKRGLMKPISVCPRNGVNGDTEYDLVCGQGRLEAFMLLGQDFIPALVWDKPPDERLLRSLVENLARRTPRMIEMVRQIGIMRDMGHKTRAISQMIDVDEPTVRAMLHLLDNGEERLLQAVETQRIPVTAAMLIAKASDEGVQKALAEAYDSGQLRGKAIDRARRIVERRKIYGKSFGGMKKKNSEPISAAAIMRAFKEESERQRLAVTRARLCEARLGFVTNALGKLLADEDFRSLLRSEKLDTLPAYLAEQIQKGTK